MSRQNVARDKSAWGGRLGGVQHLPNPAVVDRPSQAGNSDGGHGGFWGLYLGYLPGPTLAEGDFLAN